jgi:hypothetical protein
LAHQQQMQQQWSLQQWHLHRICCLNLHLQPVHVLLLPTAPLLQPLGVFSAVAAAAAGRIFQLLPLQLLPHPSWHSQQRTCQQQCQLQHLHHCCQLQQQQHEQQPVHVLLLPKAPLLQTLEVLSAVAAAAAGAELLHLQLLSHPSWHQQHCSCQQQCQLQQLYHCCQL